VELVAIGQGVTEVEMGEMLAVAEAVLILIIPEEQELIREEMQEAFNGKMEVVAVEVMQGLGPMLQQIYVGVQELMEFHLQ
jgi:hypothetical protein